jgi:hypothetical protein
MTEPSLKRTAWHEAGHAVVAWALGLSVTLVSIRPQIGQPTATRWRTAAGSQPSIAVFEIQPKPAWARAPGLLPARLCVPHLPNHTADPTVLLPDRQQKEPRS